MLHYKYINNDEKYIFKKIHTIKLKKTITNSK